MIRKTYHNDKLIGNDIRKNRNSIKNKRGETIALVKAAYNISEVEKLEGISKNKIIIVQQAINCIEARYNSQMRSKEVRAFTDHFKYGKSYESIALELYTGHNTPRRWANKIIDELTETINAIL